MKDGGPAFPRQLGEFNNKGVACQMGSEPGMSLRDYFAARTLAGTNGDGNTPENIARNAYLIADAMLAERGNVR